MIIIVSFLFASSTYVCWDGFDAQGLMIAGCGPVWSFVVESLIVVSVVYNIIYAFYVILRKQKL